LIVEDAREDPRVRENLGVRDYGIIAYLGMPLTTRDGLVLGTLCAIDKHPRKWSRLDQFRLFDLAAAVIAEIELRERSRALKESLIASEVSEEHRRSLLRMIVHDLRTPAGSISTCLEMLAEESVPLTDEQSELVSLCQESAGNLLTMINDIMEVDSIKAGGSQLAKEPISASKLVRRAIRTILPLADDAQIFVDVKLPDFLVSLSVDVRKLERVLLNLLTNALKYSPRHSTVLVIVEVVESSIEKMCKITVRDSGLGVPDAEKVQIFSQFVTGSVAGERGMKSFGIGLSFCQMAIEAHGGQIAVADAPGGGSDFYFFLPLAAGDEVAIVRSGV
jgi:signal transduction histidine kinase